MRNQNNVFNLDFLKKEYELAGSIKDKHVRQGIQTSLNRLITHLKTYKTTIERGLYCFSGPEILHVFEPPVEAGPVKKNIYKCGSHFDIDILLQLQKSVNSTESNKKQCLISLFDGDSAEFYLVNDGNPHICAQTRLTKMSINGLLIKKQKKGGQSSVRFSRLSEESRHNYCVKIKDNILASKQIAVIIVSQAEELTKKLVKIVSDANKNILLTIKKISKQDIKSIDHAIHDHFSSMDNKQLKMLKFAKLQIDLASNLLQFGKDIYEKECQYIVSISETNDNIIDKTKLVIVPKNSEYFVVFKDYVQIGIKYY